MTRTYKIGSIEAIFLVLTITINHIITNLPKALIAQTGSATLLNIVYLTIIILGIVFLISKLLKNFPNQDIIDISEFLGGKFLKNLIGILFMIYFFIASSTFLRSFCENIKIIYFPRTPILILIGVVLCNRLGMHSIVRANLMILPVVLFSIVFIFFANFENFTVQRALPLLGNGINATFCSGISNIFAFSGLAILYFLPPHLQDNKQFKTVAITSMILSAVWLLFSIATLLFIFPFSVTSEEIMPLYLAGRFIEFGRFFQRLDAIFLMTWIISMTSYLSIIMSLFVNTFKKLTNFKYSFIVIYVSAIIMLILSFLPQNYNQIHFLENTVYKYMVLILLFGVGLSILIFANIKYKKLNKRKGDVLIE